MMICCREWWSIYTYTIIDLIRNTRFLLESSAPSLMMILPLILLWKFLSYQKFYILFSCWFFWLNFVFMELFPISILGFYCIQIYILQKHATTLGLYCRHIDAGKNDVCARSLQAFTNWNVLTTWVNIYILYIYTNFLRVFYYLRRRFLKDFFAVFSVDFLWKNFQF